MLFINRVYPPAGGATGEVLADMAAGLVAAGWRVSVVTGAQPGEPNESVTDEGVCVYRTGKGGINRSSHWRRAISYGLAYPALLKLALSLPRHDVVVTMTDPPLQIVLGPIVKRVKGSRAVHWAQDVYPELAGALGVLRAGAAVGALRALSTWALKGHDRVVVIGRCMRERILGRGIEEEKVALVPNWPLAAIKPLGQEKNPFRKEHGLEGRFVVMYSGNMGLAHTFDAVLEAAARLKESLPDVLFLFVGGGPFYDNIEQLVGNRSWSNVLMLPYQPKDRLGESLAAGDVHLVTMAEAVVGLVVPSKIYGVLAAGRPVLFVGPEESEAARLVDAHGCGSVIGVGDGEGLAAAIRRWRADEGEREAAGERGRAAVEGLREGAVAAMAGLLGGLVERKLEE